MNDRNDLKASLENCFSFLTVIKKKKKNKIRME